MVDWDLCCSVVSIICLARPFKVATAIVINMAVIQSLLSVLILNHQAELDHITDSIIDY